MNRPDLNRILDRIRVDRSGLARPNFTRFWPGSNEFDLTSANWVSRGCHHMVSRTWSWRGKVLWLFWYRELDVEVVRYLDHFRYRELLSFHEPCSLANFMVLRTLGFRELLCLATFSTFFLTYLFIYFLPYKFMLTRNFNLFLLIMHLDTSPHGFPYDTCFDAITLYRWVWSLSLFHPWTMIMTWDRRSLDITLCRIMVIMVVGYCPNALTRLCGWRPHFFIWQVLQEKA